MYNIPCDCNNHTKRCIKCGYLAHGSEYYWCPCDDEEEQEEQEEQEEEEVQND